jgi:methylenetetrahydrofolate--tRNA-(uracil-5-)-methyltransferase
VVQLRRDNAAGSLWSLVGFQTNLRWGEQKRVFRLIPALAHAEFARYGVMHRNTYLKSPQVLLDTLAVREIPDLFLAGQMIGVEGYIESAASGIVAAVNGAQIVAGELPMSFPRHTMMGALCHYVSHAQAEHFQPMNANFGLFELPEEMRTQEKRDRRQWLFDRAMTSMQAFVGETARRYA